MAISIILSVILCHSELDSESVFMSESKSYLKVKDHSVSSEEFKLLVNNEFGYLETSPKPSTEKLPEYYKSEDYISHTDAKRNLFEKVYHLIRENFFKTKVEID